MYCDKSGKDEEAIRKHELSCTANPRRVCGMCKAADLKQVKMKDLKAVFDNAIIEYEDDNNLIPDFDLRIAIERLRRLTNGCPNCIFATLRQMKLLKQAKNMFSYSDEVRRFWNRLNGSKEDEEGYNFWVKYKRGGNDGKS